MINFKNEIIRFNEPKTRAFFPDKFSNEIYFSNVRDFDVFSYTSNFSIKYVIGGYEKYKVGSRNFIIRDKQYLLVNDKQIVYCKESEARAISIFLNKNVVYNVLDNFTVSEELLLENPFENKQNEINFFENIYSKNDELSLFLEYFHVAQVFNRNFNINQELFYVIAERLLQAQIKIRKSIDHIGSVKYSTRSELYRRAQMAKNFIDGNLSENFSLDILSRFCSLSKYHLLRTFKAIYNTTPYNYYLQLKIEKSKSLLKRSSLSIADIAIISGFNDVYSFYKRFKMVTGMTPTQFRIK